MSRDHSQNHYGPNASFDGYDSDLASAGILIESLRQQLADSQKREVMLRNALNGVLNMITRAQPSVDTIHRARKALAATADLDGLILCAAEPVACYQGHDKASGWETITLLENIPEGTNLYRTGSPK